MPREDREAGFAMMAVIMGVGAMLLLIVAIYRQATSEHSNAQYQRREDTILVGAEAMLERYAAKLTIDPLYYRHFVDEAELPRRCTDPDSLYNGLVVQPGDDWYDDCTSWDYQDPGGFFNHPMLEGRSAIEADDIAALLTVEPPPAGGGLTVTVVARQEEFGQTRAIVADIRPESISEFAFLVEDELRFGSGAIIRGKIYTGDDLGFSTDPPQGIVYRNAYAEGRIGGFSGYGPPIFAGDAEGYDGYGQYKDIREAYPEPLDFSKFWDDLDLIRDVACGGGGLCLSRTLNPSLGLSGDPNAWLIEPIVSGGVGELRVSVSYSSGSSYCVSSEEWWWLNSQNASWTTVGTFPIPAVGAVWADNHVVLGRPSQAAVIKGQVTIYVGSNGSRKNIILGSDSAYYGADQGTDVLGLIASDEIIINPSAAGGDRVLSIVGAHLTQGGVMRTARDCGSDGNPVLPSSGGEPVTELTVFGSRAHTGTGDMAAHFSPRNYVFDPRLESLRPPLFPLMRDEWHYGNWREVRVPCWGQDEGCSS